MPTVSLLIVFLLKHLKEVKEVIYDLSLLIQVKLLFIKLFNLCLVNTAKKKLSYCTQENKNMLHYFNTFELVELF